MTLPPNIKLPPQPRYHTTINCGGKNPYGTKNEFLEMYTWEQVEVYVQHVLEANGLWKEEEETKSE